MVDGLELIDQIKKVETTRRAGHDDVPVVDVIIESMTVIEELNDEPAEAEAE